MNLYCVWLILCIMLCVAADVDIEDDFPDEEYDIETKEGDIVQVLMVTRHGQRTPKNPYPSDPWGAAKYWPEGWLQLTAEGARQHNSLGTWLRNRYAGFIPAEFKNSDILVRSTGISRTLASAFALTSFLYPAQAIPIHSAPSAFDKLFSPHKSCPVFDREMERFLATSDVRVEEYKRQPFYEWLSHQTGKTVHGLEIAEQLYSLLTIEKQRGHVLPKWTEVVYPQPLKNLTGRFLSRSSATTLLKRLRYGSLLKDIITHAEKAGRAAKPGKKGHNRKLLIYSAHDFTVVGLLNCLGIFDGAPSGFAASITFEVRRGATPHENTVEILYRNDSNVEPETMEIAHCGKPCLVKKLKEILHPIIPVDIENECRVGVPPNLCALHRTAEDVSLLWAVALGSAALGALLVICCSKLYICGRPPLWRMYQPHVMNYETAPLRRNNYNKLTGENYAERI